MHDIFENLLYLGAKVKLQKNIIITCLFLCKRDTLMNLKKKFLDNLPSIIIMIIFIIAFTFMLTIHTQWNRAVEKYIPLKNQIVLIRNNITEAHLWLEEAIGGDQLINVNRDVIPLLAHENFHNLVNVKNKLTQSSSDKAILESFIKVDKQIDIIYSLAKERWESNSNVDISSDTDQKFDENFNNFLDLTDKAIKDVEKAFTLELQERDGYFKLILAIFLAINIFVYILLHSIKKSKKTTEKMLQKEQALATVTLKSIGDAVITVDKNARITFLNTVAENLTGYTTFQAVNLPLGDVFNIINKLTQQSVENPVDAVIKNGETVGLSNHTVLISKDGTKYDIADSAAPIHNDKEEIIGVVLVFRDVTDEYKKKEELLALNSELENRVQERTQKLEDSFSQLEKTQAHLIQTEKMASLGSLVAGISHEINTPIGLGITSMTHFVSQTQKLKERYEKEEMEQEDFEGYLENADQLAQVTYKNLKRAAELVKSFKQISIDQTSERQREFNLQDYTNETLISLQNKIKHTDVKVEVHSPKTLNIYSYPGAFSQIITNLVMNSLIHAYSAKDSGLIILNFELEESNLLFTYTDDGKGISQEHISQIFDPFFTTNRAHGGSGLGLNIIYNIVTVQLKGTLECKSEQGQGTAFIMTIPINQGNKNNEI